MYLNTYAFFSMYFLYLILVINLDKILSGFPNYSPFLLNPTPFSLFQLECNQLVNVVSDLSHVYPDLSILALKQVWARGIDTHQEESIAMETGNVPSHVLSFSLYSPPELGERTRNLT